jgi:hypothetical protein
MYREAQKTLKLSYLEGKKCAMPPSFRLVTARSSDLAVLFQPPFSRQHKQPFIAVPLGLNYWLTAHIEHFLNASYNNTSANLDNVFIR